MADAIQHNFQDPGLLLPSYALLSRMRLSSSTDVLASAERLIQHIIIMYSEPLTLEEIQSSAGTRYASSATSVVLNLKQCEMSWGNVPAGIAVPMCVQGKPSSLSAVSTDSSLPP